MSLAVDVLRNRDVRMVLKVQGAGLLAGVWCGGGEGQLTSGTFSRWSRGLNSGPNLASHQCPSAPTYRFGIP